MTLRFVRRLIFNEKIFDILLPLKDAWRDVYDFTTPSHFTSPTLLERAFSELFCCRRMDVVTGVKGQLSLPFTSLPAVRECTSLSIVRPPGPLSAVEVIEWLNVDVDSDEPRRLVMGAHQLGGSVENLVQQMKADFLGSKEARRYVITIHVGWAYNGEPGRFLNKHSSEKLTISHFGDYGRIHSVAVERKAADDEY
ncbi:hypothetical protein AAVH_37182 [Aphelenchoides avenae]|nr:hypothetical protein AAVH_37182 [Aphelenchus avenae]